MTSAEASRARAAALARRVVDHWRGTSGGFTATARRFGVTSAFVRLCVEAAGAERTPVEVEPGPTRDLADDPIDAEEVEGWSTLLSTGWSAPDVAADARVDLALVRSLLGARASKAEGGEDPSPERKPRRDPRVALLFPVGQLTPSSPCPHSGPIPKGDHVVCMVCHASGLDGIDLPRPGTVPRPPEPGGPSPPADATPEGETRRERRARLNAAR